jgi:S1-C subfamily serine protease
MLVFAIGLAAVAVGCGGGGDSASKDTTSAPTEEAGPLDRQQIVDKVRPSAVQVSVRVKDEGATGTGIVVDAAEGFILTNYHVVAGSTATNVRWGDAERPASVIALAPCEDLALIKLAQPIDGLQTIEFGSARNLRAGQELTAIGYPGSLQAGETKVTVNSGGVSVDGVVEAEANSDFPKFPEVVQHEVPINPGNSGGPLVDEQGQLVGVNTFGNADESVENQNYSVSSDRVKELLPQLIKGDSIAYMGWELLSLKGVEDSQLEEELGWTVSTEDIGMLVLNVDSGSPAAEQNIFAGDYIEKINDATINSVEEICQIAESNEGKTVDVLGYYMKETGSHEAGEAWNVKIKVQ